MSAPHVPGLSGGALAGVIMASWGAATVFWMGIGATIWRMFFEPRLKDMKAQLADERRRCDEELRELRDRVKQLETMLLLYGPAALRQQMQAALSEKEMEIRAIGKSSE
ncbi:hypothetical protein U1839_06025 [Sphingomonas sp. RT2P30]|uniref:hypothetical protein n=1 Tax=Parasphingomonas halimpatiens TaxID=3096162 RepID=UPI002FC64A33